MNFTLSHLDPVEMNEPEEMKPMVHKRRSHACTIFNSALHGGRPIMIVAGSNSGSGEKTSEIWDFTKADTSWQESNVIFFLF